jgi:uncharacterized membrane protein
MIRPLKLYLLLVGFHIGQLLWYAPKLPATVASHFDAAGEPDGWMARGVFLAFLGGVSILYLAIFLGVTAVVRRAPAALVNLPHKDYWLAPERAAATRRAINAELFKIAAATQATMIVVTQLVVDVAIGRRRTLSDAFLVALVVYFGILLWWLVALFRRFRLPAGTAAPGAPGGGGRIEPS